MSQPAESEPTLDDVIEPAENAIPDHREHAKTPKHLNEDALDDRVEQERAEVRADESG